MRIVFELSYYNLKNFNAIYKCRISKWLYLALFCCCFWWILINSLLTRRKKKCTDYFTCYQ